MITLRPHHLLCTQGYSGKGYSDGFVENMDKIVDYLRNNEDAKIMLKFGDDDLCSRCPNMDDKKLCRTEEKVRRFDEKTVKYFNLCEKEYNYRQITEYIDENMSEEMLKDICDGCSWYAISRCRANIVRKK